VTGEKPRFRDGDLDSLGSLGFRPLAEPSTDLLVELEAAVERAVGEPPFRLSLSYAREDILESDTAYYLPVTCVGSCGLLVTKRSREVIQFGSFVGAGTHVWAWLRGIEFSTDRANDIVIESVSAPFEARQALKRVWPGATADLRDQLAQPPFRIRNQQLYWSIRELRQAEAEGWFEFRVEPPTPDSSTGDDREP